MAKMSDAIRRFHGESKVPREACVFAEGQASLVAGASDTDAKRLSIVAYSGDITNHWFWGNLAIDLSGLKFDQAKTPVLLEHFTADRIGFGQGRVDDKVTVEGKFLSNSKAVELRQDMQDGFPMQASMYCPPSRVEQVAEGAVAMVNGRQLQGPGAIFREARVKEVSVCVFGAFSTTSSTAFADRDNEQIQFELSGDNKMAKDTETVALSAETLKANHAAVHDAVFTAGRDAGSKAERERFAALQKACGDNMPLLADCFTANMTVADALTKRNEQLAADLKTAKEQLAAKRTASNAHDAAVTEFKSQPAPKTDAERTAAFDEAKATDDELKAHFAATAELRDRFSSAAAYVASVRHPAK